MDDVSADQVKFAKEAMARLLKEDPEARKHVVQACAPSMALLGALFVEFGILDESVDREDVRALLGAAFIATLDISLDSVMESLKVSDEEKSAAAVEVS